MNLDAIAMRRAEEQMQEFRFSDREPKPEAERKRPGIQLCDRTCVACGSRLGETNRSGVCYRCQGTRSKRQVAKLITGELPPRKMRRATPDEIARARARLEAKGITL